jgi:predicted transposase YbfD/YdcC
MQKFRKAFRRLPDPRADNARHDLLEVLFIALAATLCGAESCSDMADFGQSKEGLLRLFLRLEHGIPSHDTFSRVFRLLKPQAFELAFRRFMAGFAKANGLKLTGVVAVDGKALRGAYERGGKATPLHLVNVFAVDARMALAQQKASGRNETAGALEVLDLLSLEGCIVTADALHCTRAFAAAVRERGGDYVLAIKANRGRLFSAVTQQFARSGKRSSAEQIDRSTHDRREARCATIMRNTSLAGLYGFPGAAAVGRITSRRRLRGQRADAPVVRHYLLSKYISPKRLLHVTRSHWGIENQLHWVLDVHLPRTATARAATMLPRTSPFCAGSPSTSCELTQIEPPCGAKSSARAGTMPSSSVCSAICDSPALQGRVN